MGRPSIRKQKQDADGTLSKCASDRKRKRRNSLGLSVNVNAEARDSAQTQSKDMQTHHGISIIPPIQSGPYPKRRVAKAYTSDRAGSGSGSGSGWTNSQQPLSTQPLSVYPGDEIEIFATNFDLDGGGYAYGSCRGQTGLFPLSILDTHLEYFTDSASLKSRLTTPHASAANSPMQVASPRRPSSPVSSNNMILTVPQMSRVPFYNTSYGHTGGASIPSNTVPEYQPKAKKANTNGSSLRKKCMLIDASTIGDMQMVQHEIKQQGYNQNELNQSFRICCKHGRLNLLHLLHGAGANIVFKDKLGRNAVHVACETGSCEVINWLFKVLPGTSFVSEDNSGRQPLHIACTAGHADLVAMLLNRLKSQINAGDRKNRTPLYSAIQHGWTQVAAVLLTANADPAITTIESRGLLHAVACQPDMSTFEWLEEQRKEGRVHWSSIDAQDKFGLTPLQIASARGHLSIVKHLVEAYGANSLVDDGRCRTALHRACRYSRMKVLDYLARSPHGTDETAHRQVLGDLTQYCVKHNQMTSLKHLLKLGVDINNIGQKHETLLHHCASQCDINSLRLIAEKSVVKIRPNQQDDGGWTALHVACARGFTDFVRALIVEFGASWSLTDTFGLTPFHTACRYGHLETAQLIGSCGGDFVSGSKSRAITDFLLREEKYPAIRAWVANVSSCSPIERCVKYGQPDILKAVLHNSDIDLEVMREVIMKQAANIPSIQRVLTNAYQPWSTETHQLFGPKHRNYIYLLIHIHHKLSKTESPLRLPPSAWLVILKLLPRVLD